jgi:riboflavin biosynthesis pyrimidine reductase
VRLLFPPADDPAEAAGVDPLDAYDEPRPAPPGRPWVSVDMVASIDGATAVEGRSGGLGGPAYKMVFRALRAIPDVVLVGAATARIEHYGPVRLDEAVQARRVARGQRPLPRLALVSARVELDHDAELFATEGFAPEDRPLVLTTHAGASDHAERFAGRAELIGLGDEHVDLAAALGALRERGAGVVLAEGGPTLNGQLVAAGLVDEWCQSLAPLLVAGDSARTAHGPSPDAPVEMALHRLLESDGELFATWRRRQ